MRLYRTVAAEGIAANKLVLDLGVCGGVGIVLGTAGGWIVGLAKRGVGQGEKFGETVAYGSGAGALFGILLVVFDRLG